VFSVVTTSSVYKARAVILALGRTGTPRKMDVKGEELPKVMYRLIEADHYVNKTHSVVGGGDSAVEAAMGLANQIGNKVTLSYRQYRQFPFADALSMRRELRSLMRPKRS